MLHPGRGSDTPQQFLQRSGALINEVEHLYIRYGSAHAVVELRKHAVLGGYPLRMPNDVMHLLQRLDAPEPPAESRALVEQALKQDFLDAATTVMEATPQYNWLAERLRLEQAAFAARQRARIRSASMADTAAAASTGQCARVNVATGTMSYSDNSHRR
jgi:hypothetical protein